MVGWDGRIMKLLIMRRMMGGMSSLPSAKTDEFEQRLRIVFMPADELLVRVLQHPRPFSFFCAERDDN
jgi:hypothetical protein